MWICTSILLLNAIKFCTGSNLSSLFVFIVVVAHVVVDAVVVVL